MTLKSRLTHAGLGDDGARDARWAWGNYVEIIRALIRAGGARRILEIGGGRRPTIPPEEAAAHGIAMTINDISARELAALPPGVNTACFDIAGDAPPPVEAHGRQDLIFSRMVLEHVADGQRAWSNQYALLAPGGVALAFIPTLYSLPFVVNRMLTDSLGAAIVKRLDPQRKEDEHAVFPARYSWCYAAQAKLEPMLAAIGFKEVAVLPFYGHGYYERLPVVRNVYNAFTAFVRRRAWTGIASYAYIVVRK